ncbi:MAG: methionyl-tRNA formyltransferase [Chitinispirillaceae bacterium]
MKIVFMGSAEFGIPALEQIMKNHTVAAVVSTPAKPKGRGLKLFDSPVTEFARQHKLQPVLTPEKLKDPSFIEQLKSLEADLFVVVAYRILPKEVFSIPALGTVNIHASLLPRFRGAAPIQRAIEAGEKETGITVFRIDEGIDTGEVLAQKRIPIDPQETTPSLYEKLSRMGAELIEDTLQKLERGNIQPLEQNVLQATKAPKLRREEAHIDWNLDARCIFNKIRAFKPFPKSFALLDNSRLGIEWAVPVDEDCSPGNPGLVCRVNKDHFDVQCGKGLLRVLEVKPEGRKTMEVRAFLLGTKLDKGTVLS